MLLGDREPALLAEFVRFAEELPAVAPSVPSAPVREPVRNSTPEERLAFFGMG